MKTLKCGSQFKEERYLSADTIFTGTSEEGFLVKSKCKASMKKEYHSQNVTLQHETGNIISAYCTCKTGKSSYCNHIMALLLELAEYSLYELTEVPSEVACTSKARKWGIPGEKDFPKEPILSTTIQRNLASRGIKSTLYNPCLSSSHCVDMDKLEALQNTLRLSNKHIGFAHIIPPPDKVSAVKTKFGMQALGSLLSYQLAPVEFNFEVHISLLDEKLPSKSHHTPFEYFTDLPVKCIPSPPKESDYSVDELWRMQGSWKQITGSKQAVRNGSQPEKVESQPPKFIESPFVNASLEAWQISL